MLDIWVELCSVHSELADSGSLLAAIYLQAGLKNDAERLPTQLCSQTVSGYSDLAKPLGVSPGAKLDQRTWSFLDSFGSTLKDTKGAYLSTMADLIKETFMYDAYTRSVSQKSPFLATLLYGSHLLQFTKEINDDAGHARADKEVHDNFAANLNASKSSSSAVIREFLRLVLAEISKPDADMSILNTSTQTISGHMDKSKFQEAYDLAMLVDRFQQFHGGYKRQVQIESGLRLVLLLAGRGKAQCQDQKLRASMFEQLTTMMKQIIMSIRSSQFSITKFQITDLNEVPGLLGEQQNLEDLEVRIKMPGKLNGNMANGLFSVDSLSPSSGMPHTKNSPGHPLLSSASDDDSWRHNSAEAKTKRQSISARTCLTIFDACGVRLTPLSRYTFSCRPSAPQFRTTEGPCLSTKKCSKTLFPTKGMNFLEQKHHRSPCSILSF